MHKLSTKLYADSLAMCAACRCLDRTQFLYMTVSFDDFHYFLSMFSTISLRVWCTFHNNITRKELLKLKLLVWSAFTVFELQTLLRFWAAWLSFSPLSLCWCPCELKQYWVKRSQNVGEVFFNTKAYLSNAI